MLKRVNILAPHHSRIAPSSIESRADGHRFGIVYSTRHQQYIRIEIYVMEDQAQVSCHFITMFRFFFLCSPNLSLFYLSFSLLSLCEQNIELWRFFSQTRCCGSSRLTFWVIRCKSKRECEREKEGDTICGFRDKWMSMKPEEKRKVTSLH